MPRTQISNTWCCWWSLTQWQVGDVWATTWVGFGRWCTHRNFKFHPYRKIMSFFFLPYGNLWKCRESMHLHSGTGTAHLNNCSNRTSWLLFCVNSTPQRAPHYCQTPDGLILRQEVFFSRRLSLLCLKMCFFAFWPMRVWGNEYVQHQLGLFGHQRRCDQCKEHQGVRQAHRQDRHDTAGA